MSVWIAIRDEHGLVASLWRFVDPVRAKEETETTTPLKCLPFPSRPPHHQQATRPLGNLNLAFCIPHPSQAPTLSRPHSQLRDLFWSPNPSSTATLQSKPSFAAHPLPSKDPQSLT